MIPEPGRTAVTCPLESTAISPLLVHHHKPAAVVSGGKHWRGTGAQDFTCIVSVSPMCSRRLDGVTSA
jgi:hypothetical protein